MASRGSLGSTVTRNSFTPGSPRDQTVSRTPAGQTVIATGQVSWDAPNVRYVRLYGLLARACLIREMSFRTNFLLRCVTHIVWLALQMVFYHTIFLHTERIGDWDRYRYLFFLGTFLTLNALVNCLFMGNCTQFSELIRTGDLDFLLLKPIDEQFLVSCHRIDWAMLPEVFLGVGLATYASFHLGAGLNVVRVLGYVALLAAGVVILYSLLLMLAATSVWTVRHQELYEIWFCVLQLASYPPHIYGTHALGTGIGFVLTYLVPMMLAVSVPARFGAMLLDDWRPIAYLLFAAVVGLSLSRWFFRFALKSYQSAGS